MREKGVYFLNDFQEVVSEKMENKTSFYLKVRLFLKKNFRKFLNVKARALFSNEKSSLSRTEAKVHEYRKPTPKEFNNDLN